MKEESFNFSLADFLGYLFPGVITLFAIAGLLLLSPINQVIFLVPLNITTGLVLIPFAYFTGVMISSLTYNLEGWLYRQEQPRRCASLWKIFRFFFRKDDPLEAIPLKGYETRVCGAFKSVFKCEKDVKWTKDSFYIARSLIREHMPKCAAISDRQNSLWQIRRNGLIPILLLGATGFVAGFKMAVCKNSWLGHIGWESGAILMLISIVAAFGLILNVVRTGMYNNRKREVREVCSALLVFDCRPPESKRGE